MAQYLQNYNPAGNAFLSTLIAALPILTLFYFLAVHRAKGRQSRGIDAWKAALIADIVAVAVAVAIFHVPAPTAAMSFVNGAIYGIFPIGWIVISAMFLYTMTVVTGKFDIVKNTVASVSSDKRIQALLIAFSFGAFVEGCAGFGTPVAIAGALLVGLDFTPLQAAILCLIANTTPVTFGSLAIPITAVQSVTGLSPLLLAKVIAIVLGIFSLVVPVWMTAVQVKMDGGKWSDVWEVWPALLVGGGSFALTQWAIGSSANYMLADVVGGIVSMVALALFCRVWQPAGQYGASRQKAAHAAQPVMAGGAAVSTGETIQAWAPWFLLTLFVFLWGQPTVKAMLTKIPNSTINWKIPFVQNVVYRMPPVVPQKVADAAVWTLNWATAPGTAIFLSAVVSGLVLGMSASQWGETVKRTADRMKLPLLTIGLVLGMGFVTRYTGMDAVLGLAFTRTGMFYPFFATFLGFVGVALSGSNTSSNVMFGSMQKITAQQLGLNPILTVSANSVGGAIGKMINPQSIVVATASSYEDQEEARTAAGLIFRKVLPHALALIALMGLFVMLLAYAFPHLVPSP